MDFQNKQQSQDYIQSIKKRQRLKHQNLAHLKYVKFESIQNWCSSFYQVITQYEYFENNLKKETLKLKRNAQKFQSQDLLRMIYDCIDVLSMFEENDMKINEIHPTILFVIKDEIDNLFRIKFQDRISGSFDPQINKFNSISSNLDLYLSPEEFELLSQGKNIDYKNKFKSDVFSIGLSFLEAGTQESFQDVYNYIQGKFKAENLYNHMRRFNKIYDDQPLIIPLLQKMLEVDQNQRPSFRELKETLPQWEEIQKVLNENSYTQDEIEYSQLKNNERLHQQQYSAPYLPAIQTHNNQQFAQFDPQSQKFVISNQNNNIQQKNPIQIFDNNDQKTVDNLQSDMIRNNNQIDAFQNTIQYDSNNQFQNFDLNKIKNNYKSGLTDYEYNNQNDTSMENNENIPKEISQEQNYNLYQSKQNPLKQGNKYLTFQQFSSQNSNKNPDKNQKNLMQIQESKLSNFQDKFQMNSQPILVDSQQIQVLNDKPENKIMKQNFQIPIYQDIKTMTQKNTKEQNTTQDNKNVSQDSLLSKDKNVPERPHLRYYEKFFGRIPKVKINQELLLKNQAFVNQHTQKQNMIRQQKLAIQQAQLQKNKIQVNKEEYNKPLIPIKNNQQQFQNYELFQNQKKQIQEQRNSSQKQIQNFDIFQRNTLNNKLQINQNTQNKLQQSSKRELQNQDNYFTRQKQYTDIVNQQSNFFSINNSGIAFAEQNNQEKQIHFSKNNDKNNQDYNLGFNDNSNNFFDYFQDNNFQYNKNWQNQNIQIQNTNTNQQYNQLNSLNNQTNNNLNNEQTFQNIYDLLEQNETNFGALPQQDIMLSFQNKQFINQNVSDDLIGFKEQSSEDRNAYMNTLQQSQQNLNNTYPEQNQEVNKMNLLSNQDIFINSKNSNKFFNLNDQNINSF